MEEDIGRKCDAIVWLHLYDCLNIMFKPTNISTLVYLESEHQWLNEPTRIKTASKYMLTFK